METSDEFKDSEIASLKEELDALKREVTVIKRALKNKIARYEIRQIKKGNDIHSILDLADLA